MADSDPCLCIHCVVCVFFLSRIRYVQVSPAPAWLVGSAAQGPQSGVLGLTLLLLLLAVLRASPANGNGSGKPQSGTNKRRKGLN